MKHNAKRFLSLLLALVMVIGLMPMSHVHAEETVKILGEKVTSVEAGVAYVITLNGTLKALTNQQGSGAWGTHTLATALCGDEIGENSIWTLEAVEGGFKIKNVNGYLNISRNTASLNETGHVFELVYHGDAGWAIKSLDSNEYGNNLGDSGSIGGWSGDGTKFDIYTLGEKSMDEIDPWGKRFWTKVSVDSETVYDAKEGLFAYAWDRNPNTIWHSNWQGAQDKLNGENTFSGVIDFGKVYTITRFSFTPRVGNNSGQITQASLYVKETEEAEWILVAEHATFAANGDKKDMDFDAQPVRFVKFVAEQSSDGWVAVSEFDIDYIAPVHEHSYEAVVTAPTCTEGGYTTYTCECGDSYTADETEALGHSYEAVVTAPTCTEGGYTTYTCSVCGDSYVADQTEALGHTDGPVVVENEKSSTCTEGGYYDAVCYCTVCGVETYRSHIVTEASGHYISEIEGYPATCTEPGLTDGQICAVCLVWVVPQEEIPALGHSYEAVVTAPTCTEGGYTTYTCSVCGDSYVADQTEALGHTDGPVVVENKKPNTCTEGGYYDAVIYCTVCGVETYRSHIVTEPSGHFPAEVSGYPATCTEPGLTDGQECCVCLVWVVPQEEIPALGHSYENGSCANCGEAEPDAVTVIAEGWSGYTTWTLTDDGVLTFYPTEERYNGKCNMANYHKVGGKLTLPWNDYAEQITKVVVTEGIHAVGQMAFYELPNLTEVVLAESVEEVRNYAFKNVTSLTVINLENVDYIREGAFYGCSALENVTFQAGVIIEDWAFSKTPVVRP